MLVWQDDLRIHPEYMRPVEITWDPDDPDQRVECRENVDRYLKMAFKIDIDTHDAGFVRLIPPQKPADMGVIRILSQNGDDIVTWCRDALNEVKEAMAKFKELLDQGYSAYTVTDGGDKGHKIDVFDPALEEIIMVPATVPG